MAKQAVAEPKKAAAKPAAKPARASRSAGESLVCEECGLVLTVADPCGCEPACEVICCEQPMRTKTRAAAARKPAARAKVAAKK
ncbi:MAG: hypothetical protein HYY32_02100 [Chloroflexi bacterium]|nr:hypothetical protein [Chloroflexota bacterium]